MALTIKHHGVMPYIVPDTEFTWGVLPVTGFELLASPQLVSATAFDATHVDVVYDRAVKHVSASNPDDALNPANYAFAVVGGVNVSAVSVAYLAGTSDQEFRVETTEQTDGATYTVTITGVESTENIPIAPPFNEANFTGVGDRPGVESATANTPSQVTVVFDELMEHDVPLENEVNYNISGPTAVNVVSVTATDWPDDKTRSVCTTFGEMTTGASYTMEVTNVSDIKGNPILGNPDNQATFSGVGTHPQVSPTGSAVAGGEACKIVFSELMGSSVLNTAYYTIEGPPGTFLSVTNVENVDDDYTYKLTTSLQTSGVTYTVTVSSDVKDLAQNSVLPPNHQATFLGVGYSPPDIFMNPDNLSTGVDIRRKLLITAVDPTEGFTGINQSSWWTRLTFSRGEGLPDLVQFAIKDGQIQTGYEGGVYRGSETDENGLTMWIRPLSRKWLELTQYQVETYVEDNEASPNVNLVIGSFITGESTCFEDSLPTPTATDTLVATALTDYPNCERLRRLILENCSEDSSDLVRGRTLMHLANLTDLRTMLAGHFDYSLVDIKLCDRLPVLDLYPKLLRYVKVTRAALNEVPQLTNEARAAILQQLGSNSAVYVVNAVAIIVLLCVLLAEE